MSVKALRNQLLGAIAMVLVAAIALGSSTFAWFSINSKVTATGMSVTTQVSNNLFIAHDKMNSTAKLADSQFNTALVENITGILEPVSTVDGTNFFYAEKTNVLGDGDTKTNAWVTYNPSDTSAFNMNYSTTGAVGYVDYVFQLKAINGSSSNTTIDLTALDLTYSKASDPSLAYRVAVFAEDITAGSATAGVGTLKAIYRISNAKYFGLEKDDADEAVSGNAAITAVSTTIDDKTSLTALANTTTYYKIVVRLWLEGEDKTCNNSTFANLADGGKWALSMAWQLDSAASGVTNITLTATAKANLATAVLASGDGATVTINGQVYTKISAVQLDGKDLYVQGTTLTSTSRIFQIENSLYPVEVTHRCTLPT